MTRRARKRKNLSSARHYDQIRFCFHTTKTIVVSSADVVSFGIFSSEQTAFQSVSLEFTSPASIQTYSLLGYREKPSFFAVGRRLGVHHQTVQRCVERAVHISRETRAWLDTRPAGRFDFTFTPKHGSWLNLIEGFSPNSPAPSCGTSE